MFKNVLFVITALTILSITSCKKNAPGGYWNFKGTHYDVVLCDGAGGELTARTNTQPFYLPWLTCTLAGPYSIYKERDVFVSASDSLTPLADSIGILLLLNTPNHDTYRPSGGYGAIQRVHVGLGLRNVSMSGTAIEMVNVADPADKGLLDLDITSTQ